MFACDYGLGHFYQSRYMTYEDRRLALDQEIPLRGGPCGSLAGGMSVCKLGNLFGFLDKS